MPPPRERGFYQSWIELHRKHSYGYDEIPSAMQCRMRPGQSVTFYFEENTTTGYTWFARYDPRMLDVEIDHKGPSSNMFGFAGAPGRAKIKIKSRFQGYTVVEIIHARYWEWANDIAPAKVVQLFIQSED